MERLEDSEAYQAGMRDARILKLEKGLEQHEKKCDARYEKIWAILNSHSRMIWIGFGLVIAMEVAILAFGREIHG